MAFSVAKLLENIQKGGSDLLLNPKPGNYIAKLDSVTVGVSKTSGRLQVGWFFVVDKESPNHANETIGVFHGIQDKDEQEDEYGISNMSKFIDKLEIPKPTSTDQIDSPEKLQAYLKTGIGRVVRLTAKKGNTPDSLFVNMEKLVSAGDGTASSESFPTPTATAPTAITFKVGDLVDSGGFVYEVKSLLDATRLVGQNKSNSSVAILETKDCKPVAAASSAPVVTPQQAPPLEESSDQVELTKGMRVTADNKGVAVSGIVVSLDENTGQVVIQDGSNFIVVTPNDITGIFPADKQENTTDDGLFS